MRIFEKEYERLNAGQKQAVDTVEGPVMVVAGPGTGKTQVLGMRVANILKKTQAKPSNILCLTFSTSGATAMRERLRELIGPDAYGVTVSYSTGMLTRLAFALSMAIEFDCFLIDEAMVVGDARFHEKCHIELFQKRKDRAFILVTHDASVIKLYCERASVLHEGKLYPFDTVDEAYDFYNNRLKMPAPA